MRRLNWHLGAGAILLVFAVFLGYDMYRLDALSHSEKQGDNITKILLATFSGLAALYLLIFKHDQEIYSIQEKGRVDRENIVTKAAIEAAITKQLAPKLRALETQAAAAQKYAELALTEDFSRRDERHALLKGFSEQVIFASREFRKLVKYRPTSDGSAEAIVDLLAQALAARQSFIVARDKLEPMHIVDPEHKPVIRQYSGILINIIIDVRRPSDLSSTTDEYSEVMHRHSNDLESAHDQICAILKVFLAPQHRHRHRHRTAGLDHAGDST